MTLSRDTLVLCRGVLQNQQLQVGHPDFVSTALAVLKALEELDEALNATAQEGADAR